ncbi:hypothetical protein [Pseudoduganella rhizocola]|uniref:hypothetical protein n=1 Tax=Pseudoduganella rhizocola TaxID=3382643 RepID=UPI0038B52421
MPSPTRLRALHAGLLACALLFASHIGWQHRIAHQPGHPFAAAKYAHSCAAFDAATLADQLPAAPRLCHARPERLRPGVFLLPLSWFAPFTRRYSPRAPPAARRPQRNRPIQDKHHEHYTVFHYLSPAGTGRRAAARPDGGRRSGH